MPTALILLIGLSPIGAGCGSGADRIVAKVGEKCITVKDLKEGWAKLPDAQNMAAQQALWMLISKELLLLEARERGLDRDEGMAQELERLKTARMAEEVDRTLRAQIVVSEEQIRTYFQESGMEDYKEVQIAHIVVRTQEEADDIVRELDQGADFAELARARSLDRETAAKGGDLGCLEQGIHFGTLVNKVLPLEVGQVAKPFREPTGRYRILKKCDERPIGFEKQRPRIRALLERRDLKRKKEEYLQQLREQFGFKIHTETLQLLLSRSTRARDNVPEVASEDLGRTLFSYEGGDADLGQYLDRLRELQPQRRPAAGDSIRVVRFIESVAAIVILLPEAFRREGPEKTEEMRSYLDRKKEELMVTELRRRVLEEGGGTDETGRELDAPPPNVGSEREGRHPSEGARDVEDPFERFLLRLREKYADRITVYEKNLRTASL
jgi:peptidyl-prolyl cis-trans isomerase C